LQLRNSQNEAVASYDHFPFSAPKNTSGHYYQILPSIDPNQFTAEDIAIYPREGMLPTKAWEPGHVIREVYTVHLPANLPPDKYNLYIGLYDPETLHRLPVQTEYGTDDGILAAQIVVEAAQ
jgi:hypothetical protein